MMAGFERKDTIYQNSLSSEADLDGFVMEGKGVASFPLARMRLENFTEPTDDNHGNFVLFCPVEFQIDVSISWDFWPVREPGLSIMFFAAQGRGGEDILESELLGRSGDYRQYHSSDLNALHISYFRRRWLGERALHTCNLRKSHGFHLVCQGADPIPPVPDCQGPYRIEIVKCGPNVAFSINDLLIFEWEDDGQSYGRVLGGGKIGFRQMAPLMAEYANLTVHDVTPI